MTGRNRIVSPPTPAPTPTHAAAARRGFLLIVVIGLLAILLALCIGLLALTTSEVSAVAHVRDKSDARNVMWTACDWMLANIQQDLIDPATGQFKANSIVSKATDPSDPQHRWWYKPYEPNFAEWWKNTMPSTLITAKEEAQWVYLPKTFFPGGGVRGRFYVQVLDPNSCININDWLDDCSPTQCQMAHMITDALGDYAQEQPRGVNLGLLSNKSKAANYVNNYPHCAFRYIDGWHVASRAARYGSPGSLSPRWQTTNEIWMGLEGAENALSVSEAEQGIGGMPLNVLAGFTKAAYNDPDTGRSPVNVNTCSISGDDVPMNVWGAGQAHTLEGVFNVESLRRIVKIGRFWNDDTNAEDDLTKDTDGSHYAALSPAMKQKLEQLKTKLAYQYQETIVRYFTAAYDHGSYHQWYYLRGPSLAKNTLYLPYGRASNQFRLNYVQTYKDVLGSTEANAVKHFCVSATSDKTRFPCGVDTFRQWVHDDLAALTVNNRNTGTNNHNTARVPLYTGSLIDGREFVGVDKNGNFEILPGKLDARTAAAIYDNIVPGKALLFPGDANIEVRDPLGQLYKMRWSRREEAEPDAWQDYTGQFTGYPRGGRDVVWSGGGGTVPKGPYDLVATEPPYRQLAFGPDSFSTELTTTTTNFVFVIRAQVVDNSVINPLVLMDELVSLYVEIAPDVEVEPNVANYYYRTGLPAYYKTAPDSGPTARDSMDHNCVSKPDTGSSVAKEWVDYRGVAPAERGTFYAPLPGGKQTKKRIIIRMVQDQNTSGKVS